MTTLLYLKQPFLYKTTTSVKQVFADEETGKFVVVLEQTVFYPQGGGQPYDIGTISSSDKKFLVQEVRFVEGEVRHIGFVECGVFKEGDIVLAHIDEERRVLLSRIHSAGHLIDKAVLELALPWVPGKGYHYPAGPYVEYGGALDTYHKERIMKDIELLCNAYIQKGGKTDIVFMTREEMTEKCHYTPDFPSEKGEKARIVIHDGYMMPCGGTPVEHLRDIKGMVIRKITQEGNKVRVSYALSG